MDEKKRFSKLKGILKGSSDEYDGYEEYDDEFDTYESTSEPKGYGSFKFEEMSTKDTKPASTAPASSSYSKSSTYSQPSATPNYVPYSSSSAAQTSHSTYSAAKSSYGTSASTGSAAYKPSSTSSQTTSKTTKFRLSILRLEKLEDAVKVADEILTGNTISLIDLRSVPKDIIRRVIDFIDGVRYTCKARMEIVADYTYVVVPKDVELSGDLFSQIDTGSF